MPIAHTPDPRRAKKSKVKTPGQDAPRKKKRRRSVTDDYPEMPTGTAKEAQEDDGYDEEVVEAADQLFADDDDALVAGSDLRPGGIAAAEHAALPVSPVAAADVAAGPAASNPDTGAGTSLGDENAGQPGVRKDVPSGVSRPPAADGSGGAAGRSPSEELAGPRRSTGVDMSPTARAEQLALDPNAPMSEALLVWGKERAQDLIYQTDRDIQVYMGSVQPPAQAAIKRAFEEFPIPEEQFPNLAAALLKIAPIVARWSEEKRNRYCQSLPSEERAILSSAVERFSSDQEAFLENRSAKVPPSSGTPLAPEGPVNTGPKEGWEEQLESHLKCLADYGEVALADFANRRFQGDFRAAKLVMDRYLQQGLVSREWRESKGRYALTGLGSQCLVGLQSRPSAAEE